MKLHNINGKGAESAAKIGNFPEQEKNFPL